MSNEQARLKSIVETAVDGIITIDAEGLIDSVNPAAERLFGYSAQELLGKNVSKLMPPFFANEHPNYLRRYRETGQRGAIGRSREVTGMRKDGSRFPMRLSVGEFWLEERQMFTGVIHDLTEQKRAEERALQSERLAAMGQMLSALTHESRNALQITQANLELLELELPPDSELQDFVVRIQMAQNRLQALFEELRSFAAPIVLELQTHRVDQLLERALWQFNAARTNRKVQLASEPCATDLRCGVDRFRMERVFLNLLTNAVDAGEDPVVITTNWQEVQLDGNSALELRFRDNGPGLSREMRERMFEPFFTTKPTGTGLGMAICKRIIESHGGRITLGDSNQRGAEFVITLPRSPFVAKQAQGTPQSPAHVGPA